LDFDLDHRDVVADTFILRFHKPGWAEFGDSDGEFNADNICQPRSPSCFNTATFIWRNLIVSAHSTSIFTQSPHHKAALANVCAQAAAYKASFFTACAFFANKKTFS